MDESLIVGENCLKQSFSQNPNSCPIESHNNCLYLQNRLAKRYIGKLDVICPRQFERGQGYEEGETSGFVNCDFKGKIKQVDYHLENSFCLQVVKCLFEPFGCNYTCLKSITQDHLISNMQLHFNLVIKSFNALKQNIQQYQEEIKKLNLENERLKVELKLKGKKDEKQQLEQNQKDIL
ncbi:hypothetical protein RFI_38990 [Reticulomyxa filosa]|uniref:TRAF-type domain-containing protein n=1 Tax=Reticulomyxa filosa TaxID=46433 RepID=X6LBI8_RETFI|nr:hypothetical protein RFI_38990 [Reticulomyxa filosa]|eukprot:ETN98501.1 hypothetical protein RFI_38990 [Reticulomyxa filosa]